MKGTLAERFYGVTYGAVSDIIRGKTWTDTEEKR